MKHGSHDNLIHFIIQYIYFKNFSFKIYKLKAYVLLKLLKFTTFVT
jgi:hypothetical protein